MITEDLEKAEKELEKAKKDKERAIEEKSKVQARVCDEPSACGPLQRLGGGSVFFWSSPHIICVFWQEQLGKKSQELSDELDKCQAKTHRAAVPCHAAAVRCADPRKFTLRAQN